MSQKSGQPLTKFKLTIVVMGKPYTDEFNINEPLHAVAQKALAATNNTGRPLTDWKLTTQSGQLLSFDTKLKDSGVQNGTTLFLDLKEGGGGSFKQ